MNRLILTVFIILLASACSRNPYATANKKYKKQARAFAKILTRFPLEDSVSNEPFRAGTTNFDMRRPNFVIIHHTAQNACEQTINTFTNEKSKVSAHYVICKDGTVHHMLNDYLRAWQAGLSRWGNNTDINSSSIGIELDNNGFEYFTEPQINSLIELLGRLKRSFNLPAANFIGHGDIAPGRKVDPNWRFPWKQLADNGFGYWFGDTSCVTVPPNFDHLQALRVIGYDMKDTSAVIASFKRHWLQDTTIGLSEDQYKVLYQVSSQY
ncbi:MAG: N-acetylmuramoyl-L-alanine amidase [Chitinophagaceae bacterium]|nr:N-acetylmuramoyl-L-alanine amidase [Chitinophagaceae bacterium]